MGIENTGFDREIAINLANCNKLDRACTVLTEPHFNISSVVVSLSVFLNASFMEYKAISDAITSPNLWQKSTFTATVIGLGVVAGLSAAYLIRKNIVYYQRYFKGFLDMKEIP